MVHPQYHILLDQRNYDGDPSYQVPQSIQTVILRSSRGRLVPNLSNWNGNIAHWDYVVRYPLLWCESLLEHKRRS
jgi:hypothetical protein